MVQRVKNATAGLAGDMFRAPETEGGQAGSRAMKPPGEDSSSLFGSPEEAVPSSRPNRMASNIFGPTEEPQNVPKRTNPPGMYGPLRATDPSSLPVLVDAALLIKSLSLS